MECNVVFEDNHLLVLNKPGGIPVQKDPSGDVCLQDLAHSYIRDKYKKTGNIFCEVTHRIDRPVSGLVLMAKTSKALVRINQMFQDKGIQKTYFALVGKRPSIESGTLEHWLTRNTKTNVTSAHAMEVKNSQKAVLHYSLIGEISPYFLLEIRPITGRTHQIRCQLSVTGFPIVGDVKYRFRGALEDRTIALHARKLEFIHPVTQIPLVLEASLPRSPWWEMFEEII